MANLAQREEASLYERDFCAWTEEQVRILKTGDYTHLDIENVVEELESLGRSEQRELCSRLEVLLAHLLKWSYEAKRHSRSWENSIDDQRERIQLVFKSSPSLRGRLGSTLVDAYRLARRTAGNEMNLEKREWDALFPQSCPWHAAQVLDEDFYPAPASPAEE
ncbi:MAG: DUF29 domain-containing protein [Candidatus Binataceae bacterium]